jgi:PhnB protein
MKINPYLHFDGTCKTAFDYYVKHLGAKPLMSMTYAQAPASAANPPGCEVPSGDRIMHARIQIGESVLMGSDTPEGQYRKPCGFFVSLEVENVDEAERFYAALSKDGEVQMPLGETFWADRFAMLEDQFGIPWTISLEKKNF